MCVGIDKRLGARLTYFQFVLQCSRELIQTRQEASSRLNTHCNVAVGAPCPASMAWTVSQSWDFQIL